MFHFVWIFYLFLSTLCRPKTLSLQSSEYSGMKVRFRFHLLLCSLFSLNLGTENPENPGAVTIVWSQLMIIFLTILSGGGESYYCLSTWICWSFLQQLIRSLSLLWSYYCAQICRATFEQYHHRIPRCSSVFIVCIFLGKCGKLNLLNVYARVGVCFRLIISLIQRYETFAGWLQLSIQSFGICKGRGFALCTSLL